MARKSYDVVIIGAGVIGTSIAFHLARHGCRNVAVFEKDYIGSGATEKCAGGIRQQFSTPENIRLSIESLRFFEQFEAQTGQPIDFRQHGYMFLATSQQEIEIFRSNVSLQRELGVDVRLMFRKEVSDLIPHLNSDDISGATLCRRDGFADPYSVVQGFAGAARRMGVDIIESCEVTAIDVFDHNIKGVQTATGTILSPRVVNAAGAYASVVGKMAGLDIPVHPTRRHIFVSEPLTGHLSGMGDPFWAGLPLVIEYRNGFWFRREGNRMLVGMRNPLEKEGFDISPDWDFFAGSLAPVACHRLPPLADIGITRAQVGLHPDTPDDMAIMGRVEHFPGLFLACGFSGHGFMHSPAVGRLMADLILGKITSLPDADVFNLERFRGQLRQREQSAI